MPLTEQLADGVHRVPDGVVNWYVVEDGDEVALYDAGWPRSGSRVDETLGEVGRTRADVAHVVLTHGHPDHLGAAEALRRGGATVHVHRPEVPRALGEAKGASPFALVPSLLGAMWRPSAAGFVGHATLRGFMNPTWLEDAEPFEAGERLDVPGRPLAVATPGHTEGHASFLLEDAGVLVTGDAMASYDVLTHDEGPRLMPDRVNADPLLARTSLGPLASLRAGTVAFGHGDPFHGEPVAAVERSVESPE